jgi:hypothetical protein
MTRDGPTVAVLGPHSHARPMPGMLPSLAAFLRAGVRPSTPLAKAIVVALAVKVCVLVVMQGFLFGRGSRPVVDAAAVTRHFAPAAEARSP